MMQHATDPNLIRHRAYELWLERGAPDGSPDHDWMSAERELRAVTTAAPVAAVESSAPAPIVRKPRRARAIVTRSAAPAGDALRALAPEATAAVAPESGVREQAPRRARRAAQKRSA
jgi:hypothetical protein